jgi:protocatechuate 3,4-dioxygenase alpha subunit
MVQPIVQLKETPSQTAGPYVHIGLAPNFIGIPGIYGADLGATMVNERTKGERITITGKVIDGGDAPLKDAVVEIWQADASGLFNSPSEMRGAADPDFTGWGRQPANLQDGTFVFNTIKPGAVPWPDGRMQAPHISFWIVARGINLGLHTRMYFSDEEEANARDPLLARIEQPSRAKTLIAQRNGNTCAFDIRLQGPHETVFFDI